MDPSVFHQLLVQLLKVVRGQLSQFNVPDAGDGVGLNHEFVAIGGGSADIGFGIEVIPCAQPCGYGVLIASDNIQTLALIYGFLQLFFYLGLRFSQHIFVDSFSGVRVVSCAVSTFPATVFSFTDISFSVGTFFWHRAFLLSVFTLCFAAQCLRR